MKAAAFIIPDLSLGGAQRSLIKLAGVLADGGRDVSILCMGRAAIGIRDEINPKVRLMCFESRHSASLRLLFRLWRTLRALRVDTVVGWSLYANFVAIVLGRLAAVRTVVISERNYPVQMFASPENTDLRRRLLWTLLRMMYPMADVITANSERTLRFLRRFLRRSGARFEQLPNIVETEFCDRMAALPAQPPLPEPAYGPRIAAVGRLHAQKGFDSLLRALAALPPMQPWELVLAGDGPQEEELRALIRQLGLDQRVHVVGSVDNPFAIYRWADLVVVPSRYEGFPNVPLEAMCVGAAVIISDCETGPRELSANGTYARLVPVDDVAALTAAIIDLGSNLSQARQLGAAARQHVQRVYGRERVEKTYLTVFSH
jgi:glycosyltransferase involved in cell wall biosynthesis